MLGDFSDFIVYVDESGDHSLVSIDKGYPMFVLAFCIFNKRDYLQQVVPQLQQFKFNYFGHDLIILHEYEIRKSKAPFNILMDRDVRENFMEDLNKILIACPMTIVAVAIKKEELKESAKGDNPYHLALELGLKTLMKFTDAKIESEKLFHLVFERRGKKEDDELEFEFLRLKEALGCRFEAVFIDKKSNSTGLQLADLVARPIGRYVLKPEQQNRAFEILKEKFYGGENQWMELGLIVWP